GTVHAHVPEHRRAWHAGRSWWRGAGDVNSRSIGSEVGNPGHDCGLAPLPGAGVAALAAAARQVRARDGIAAGRVVRAGEVARARTADPGELFPWAQLARAGVGLRPAPDTPGAVAGPAEALAGIGYGVAVYGEAACLRAFQRRFRPARIDGIADAETRALLGRVLRLAGPSP